jgi:hypothetical protein
MLGARLGEGRRRADALQRLRGLLAHRAEHLHLEHAVGRSELEAGQPERSADAVRDHLAEARAGRALHDLRDHPVGRRGVVLGLRPGLPVEAPGGEARHPCRAVGALEGAHRGAGKSGRVREEMLEGHGRFPVRPELGDQVGDTRGRIHRTVPDRQPGGTRREGLGDGEHGVPALGRGVAERLLQQQPAFASQRQLARREPTLAQVATGTVQERVDGGRVQGGIADGHVARRPVQHSARWSA